MADNIYDYELADIRLRMLNINEREKSFCDELLSKRISHSINNVQYTYEFHKNIDEIKEKQTPIELMNAKYYIRDDVCYVRFKNNGKAIWDFSSKSFKYQDGNKFENLRNWFFLNVIDPFSLVCIKESKLVVHGSLWEKKGIGSIICGESGSGKSTLSFLVRDEVIVHSDDCLVLTLKDKSIIANPIHSGFGLKKDIIQKYDVNINSQNILIENNEKIYLKSLSKERHISVDVPVKNIFILKKKSFNKTQVIKLNNSFALKEFLNLQTNLPTQSFKAKYILIKSILDRCNVFAVEYNEICDIEVLLNKVVREQFD